VHGSLEPPGWIGQVLMVALVVALVGLCLRGPCEA
jgi:hypothetical protein